MLMKVIIPLVPSMGLLFGVLAEQSFYIEGEAAKELYRLPLTKRSIALSKTFSSLVAMLPAGLLICVIASYLLGPLVGIMTFVLLEVNTAASLSFNSSLTVSMLPTEPSSWSERSIGSKRPLIRIGLVLASIVLGGLFAVVAIVTPVGEIAFVGLSVLVLLIAAVAYQRLPDAPLTF